MVTLQDESLLMDLVIDRSFLNFFAFHYNDIDGSVGTVCSGNNFSCIIWGSGIMHG